MDGEGMIIEQKGPEGPNGWTVIVLGGGVAVGLAIIGLALFSLANWAGVALVVASTGTAVGSICRGIADIIEARGRARAMLPAPRTRADMKELFD